MTARSRRIALGAAFVLVVVAGIAAARPGGGESFSGGGGHSSGGGGGNRDGGAILELLYWLFYLIVEVPQFGVPLLLFIIGLIIYSAYKQHRNRDWDSGPPAELQRATELSDLRRIDLDFSQVVFEDFAFRLFSTAHRARASEQTLAAVAPYVSAVARTALATRNPRGEPVEQVVVGALRVIRADIPAEPVGGWVEIAVQFEANVATAAHTYYSVETWLFARDATRHSKPPSTARTFPCPNCGAPWQAASMGTQVCASCGQAVDNGRFDWIVQTISLLSNDERPPTLTTEVPERGTDLETYSQDDFAVALQALMTADPAFTREGFEGRLGMIYTALNGAWANNKLSPIQGFVSDGLYDYLAYWVDAYVRQGLRNQLTDMRITKVQYAKIVRDRWFDAITIRIWATGKDFVVRSETGDVVRGSKHRERPYSEYWTLIRSAGRKGPPKADRNCGNCGAPLQIAMGGTCEHCGAHVTAGEFDWVVSKIEQDDSYRG